MEDGGADSCILGNDQSSRSPSQIASIPARGSEAPNHVTMDRPRLD